MSEYYKKIKGKNYDRHLLDLADELTAARKSGKLIKDDAQDLYDALADANRYTDVEKRTMAYIRKYYKFTEAGDTKLRGLVRSWASKKGWETRKKNAKKK